MCVNVETTKTPSIRPTLGSFSSRIPFTQHAFGRCIGTRGAMGRCLDATEVDVDAIEPAVGFVGRLAKVLDLSLVF